MIKKLCTLILSLVVLQGYSQYYLIPNPNAGTNPGSINSDDEYPSGGGLPAGWVTALGANNSSPAWSTPQNIPFTFTFNGASVTQFKVSSSGVLTFDVSSALAAPSYTRAALPNAAIPNNSICIWGLGGVAANDMVVTKTFGTAPNRQHWIQFSSYGYGTTPSDGSNFTYWSIVLEETTNKVHIVDNRTGGFSNNNKVSAGLQYSASSALMVPTSPDLLSLAGTDPSPADNSFYTFIPGTQPAYDVNLLSITTPPYVGQGNTTISGILRNLGSATVTSVDVKYQIDGGAWVNATLTGLSVAPLTNYSFNHSTPWNATIGSHTLVVTAENVNNNPDANPSDNTKTLGIQVMSETVVRVPLFEIFTSSTCGPCKPGNENFHSIIDSIPSNEFAYLKYQQDFPGTGDPYTTVETKNRRSNYYGINSIPRMENDGGWDGNANSFTVGLYNSTKAVPAMFKMQGTFNLVNQTFTTKVKFSPLINQTGAKLYVAIVEKKTVNNVKSNGETEFINVVKKMLPNETGSAMPNTAIGAWDSITLSYTVAGNYRLPQDGQTANIINLATEHSYENMYNTSGIAWIQAADKKIYQAINLTSGIATGVTQVVNTIHDVNVYPNPATTEIKVSYNLDQSDEVMYMIVDAMGNNLKTASLKAAQGKNTITVDVSSYAAGLYHIMMFDSKGNSHVEPIDVIR